MEVIILDGIKGKTVMDALEALQDIDRANRALESATLLYAMAKRLTRGRQHDELVAYCGTLLAAHNPDPERMTPEIMAERMERIAARPQALEVTDEGRIFYVSITDPNNNGEVWVELILTDAGRAGLKAAWDKHKAEAPTTPDPQ